MSTANINVEDYEKHTTLSKTKENKTKKSNLIADCAKFTSHIKFQSALIFCQTFNQSNSLIY